MEKIQEETRLKSKYLWAIFVIWLLYAGGFSSAYMESNNYGKIAFVSDRPKSRICVMDADGNNTISLTDDLFNDEDPCWSPDGERIAFTSDRDGNDEIYIMQTNGSNVVRLTSNSSSDWNPAWSPDGTKIAFVRGRYGDEEIYVMNADGTGQENLTNSPHGDYGPCWSPDSSKIAFISGRDGRTSLYVMNSDGSNVKKLATDVFGLSPAWSPNGKEIIFGAKQDNRSGIFAINLDGTAMRRCMDVPSNFVRFALSPQGTRIAYSAGEDEISFCSLNADR
jgi:tol-pal system beta propeller repeat protein TolB